MFPRFELTVSNPERTDLNDLAVVLTSTRKEQLWPSDWVSVAVRDCWRIVRSVRNSCSEGAGFERSEVISEAVEASIVFCCSMTSVRCGGLTKGQIEIT